MFTDKVMMMNIFDLFESQGEILNVLTLNMTFCFSFGVFFWDILYQTKVIPF